MPFHALRSHRCVSRPTRRLHDDGAHDAEEWQVRRVGIQNLQPRPLGDAVWPNATSAKRTLRSFVQSLQTLSTKRTTFSLATPTTLGTRTGGESMRGTDLRVGWVRFVARCSTSSRSSRPEQYACRPATGCMMRRSISKPSSQTYTAASIIWPGCGSTRTDSIRRSTANTLAFAKRTRRYANRFSPRSVDIWKSATTG